MRIIKRINHNAVVCLDSRGREVVALGRGIGFPDQGDDVDIARINRTYYNVDDRYLALFEELPLDVLDCTAQIADVIRGVIPYELSPSFSLTLADHIAFMLKRAREHLKVSMPLSYDVAHLYPFEYRMGVFTVERVERAFGVHLDESEAVGIAMSILSAALPQDDRADESDTDTLLDAVTRVIEADLGISIDRDGVAFARFATHVLYLIRGAHAGAADDEPGTELLAALENEYPAIASCAARVAEALGEGLGSELDEGERIYLTLHINRLYAAATRTAGAEADGLRPADAASPVLAGGAADGAVSSPSR